MVKDLVSIEKDYEKAMIKRKKENVDRTVEELNIRREKI